MSVNFFDRLADYYEEVGQVLRGEAAPAKILPYSSDKGMTREAVYCKFLRQHTPAKCAVKLGGFLFQEDGNESDQMDVIVTTDTAPRFDFYNESGYGKSFACVEGTLGAFSIKSTLDKTQLFDALHNIASIPPTLPLGNRIPPKFAITDYDDWPYKFIYASDGMLPETLNEHLQTFYRDNPNIPLGRRPNMIHIAGKAWAMRAKSDGWGVDIDTPGNTVPVGCFSIVKKYPDVQAIMWTLHYLHKAAGASTQILYETGPMMLGVAEVLQRRLKAITPPPAS